MDKINKKLKIALREILFERALKRISSKQYDKATPFLKAILLDYPDNRQAKEKLSFIYIEKSKQLIKDNKLKEAKEYIESILETNPESAICNYLLSYIHKLKEEPTKATIFKILAKKLNPDIETDVLYSGYLTLKIENTSVKINKILNTITDEINLIIKDIIDGPGKLTLVEEKYDLLTTRLSTEDDNKEDPIFKGKLIIDNLNIEIRPEEDNLIIKSASDISLKLTNELGNEIKETKEYKKGIHIFKV